MSGKTETAAQKKTREAKEATAKAAKEKKEADAAEKERLKKQKEADKALAAEKKAEEKKQKEEAKAKAKAPKSIMVIGVGPLGTVAALAVGLDLNEKIAPLVHASVKKNPAKVKKVPKFTVSVRDEKTGSRQKYSGPLRVVSISSKATPGSGEYPTTHKVYIGDDGYLSAEVSTGNSGSQYIQQDVDFMAAFGYCMDNNIAL